MNIKFALTFEPDNEVFKEHLVEAEAAFKEADAKEKNPYKLRNVGRASGRPTACPASAPGPRRWR